MHLIQWYLIVVPHWLVLWCHRCLTRPWFLWRKLSCSHDLTAVSWSHSPRCWRSHVCKHCLSHAHLSGTITSASHRCLQVNFQCHQRLVVDDKNFSLQTLHTWSINTMLFLNYWAPFSSSSGKATYSDWETRNCAQKCLCTGVEGDLPLNGCTKGFRGPGECQAVSLKTALDKIAAQAVTCSSWGGSLNKSYFNRKVHARGKKLHTCLNTGKYFLNTVLIHPF